MQSSDYRLVIGDKNYSSWSLRPWLAMKRSGIAFDEINVYLGAPDRREKILEHSPSGLVPALKTGDLTIFDTLAILEYLAEQHPEAALWPFGTEPRAMARSVAAEMHSGFYNLRNEMPMDYVRTIDGTAVSDRVAVNVRRIVSVWRQCRADFGAGGGFLFGGFSIADAMYAPVASRFRTYGVDLSAYGDDGTAADYRDHVLAMPELGAWAEGARAEMAERGDAI